MKTYILTALFVMACSIILILIGFVMGHSTRPNYTFSNGGQVVERN